MASVASAQASGVDALLMSLIPFFSLQGPSHQMPLECVAASCHVLGLSSVTAQKSSLPVKPCGRQLIILTSRHLVAKVVAEKTSFRFKYRCVEYKEDEVMLLSTTITCETLCRPGGEDVHADGG